MNESHRHYMIDDLQCYMALDNQFQIENYCFWYPHLCNY
jgi:hypothetical protein